MRQVDIEKKYSLDASAKFGVLNVEELIKTVSQETFDQISRSINLTVYHYPVDILKGELHGGIFDIPIDQNKLIGRIIADILEEEDLYSARSYEN